MKTPPDLLNTASAVNTVESGLNSLDTLQEALRDREEFVARMIESSQDCFTIIDLEGRLMSVNSGGLQALGIDDFAPYATKCSSSLRFEESVHCIRRFLFDLRHNGRSSGQ